MPLSLRRWNGSFDTGRTHLSVEKLLMDFSQPLLRPTFSARLRALRNSALPSNRTDNVYVVSGVVAFTGES